MEEKNEVLILLDADVIIHLFKAERITLLNELYPKRIRILDFVKNELLRNPTIKTVIENLFLWKQVEEIEFPISLFNEFKELKSRMEGIGERACLVYCKHHKHIIASSNTKDIKSFCKEHQIAYLTTLDILAVAYFRRKLSSEEINQLIKKITKNNESFLCCGNIEEHISKHFNNEKLIY